MSHGFFENLSPDCVILTANSRLSLYLHDTYDEYQHQQKKSAWATPQILPLQNWLQQQFAKHNHEGFILLDQFQENYVWQQVITQSKLALDIKHPAQLATLVQDAWHIITQWQVPQTELAQFQNQDEVNCLLTWFAHFQKQCVQKNWITASQLPEKLLAKKIHISKKIILMGFDDFNPVLKKLWAQFDNIEIQNLEIQSDCARLVLEDTESELHVMASWIKKQWQENPAGKFCCVVPELEKIRTSVERVFTETLCIEKIFPGNALQNAPFNISAGKSLAENPLVHAALTLLQWTTEPLPIQKVADILQSSYLCNSESDAAAGAQIDSLLRDRNYLYVTPRDVLSVMLSLKSAHHFTSPMRLLLQFSQEKKSYKPSEWAEHFIVLLKNLHWPGERTQTSQEFQALEKFKKTLFQFSQLNFLVDQIKLFEALSLFCSLIQKTLFQVKSHHEPIQIMGALEASSIVFDAVWVMGLHDGIWPANAKPHALIPYAIQKKYAMPHASAERELQFCEQITKRLKTSAKQVVFSSPKKEADQQLFPSALISDLNEINLDVLQLEKNNTLSEKIWVSQPLEIIADNTASSIQHAIRGGSTILKSQALCGYQAFAKICLQAKALNTPILGIPAVKKGILVHHILFLLWQYLKDQKTLLSLSDETLESVVARFIHEAFEVELPKAQYAYQNEIATIEKERLQILMLHWLALEKTRPEFSIKALETNCQILIDKLPLELRLDRIDELLDGSLLLIDYKTGKTNVNVLLQERLADPQLPLYVAFDKNFSAVAFAQVNNYNMLFEGIAHEDKSAVTGIKSIADIKNKLQVNHWETLMHHWQKSLTDLAKDFCDGKNNINPLDNKTCLQCNLHSVCRVKYEHQ